MNNKVSKQTLAIVALSLLLAIAMALTVTFAAFSNTNTVNGSITFSGDVVFTVTTAGATNVSLSGTPSTNGATFTVSISGITDDTAMETALAGIRFGLTSTSVSAYMQIVLTDPSGANAGVLTPTYATGTPTITSNAGVTVTANASTKTYVTGKMGASDYVTLGDLVSYGVNLNNLAAPADSTEACTFSFTVKTNAAEALFT